MKEQPSSQQQGVWVCGRPAPHGTDLPLIRPSTYPRPTARAKGGTLPRSHAFMTKS
jgi:hypothetical protein